MGEVVSQAKFFVDGPFGNFQLKRVKSADVTVDEDAEVVTAVGVEGGAGIRFKTGGGAINLEVYREQGKPEVDWRKERKNKTRFVFTIQDTGGTREQYSCAVAQVTRKADDAGSHMDAVKLVWTQNFNLPVLPV